MANTVEIMLQMRDKLRTLAPELNRVTMIGVELERLRSQMAEPARRLASVQGALLAEREKVQAALETVKPRIPEPMVLPDRIESPETMRLGLLLEETRGNTAVVKAQAQLLHAQGELLQGTVNLLSSMLQEQRKTNLWMVITAAFVAATLIVALVTLIASI